MTSNNTLSVLTGAAVLLVLLGGGYYYYAHIMPQSAELPVPVTPDYSVLAGPVVAISAGSISITKQDNAEVTFAIVPGTAIVASAEGRPGDPRQVSDIKVGSFVLITPSSDGTGNAQTIILVQ